MVEKKVQPTTDSPETWSEAIPVGRRNLIRIVSAGIIGGTIGTGTISAASHEHPHRIVFDGTKTSTTADYEFGVSGAIEPDGDVGALETDDTIDGTTVVGVVHQDKDAYRFSGSLTSLDVSGEIEVHIEYANTSTSDGGPRRFEIVTPSDGSVDYEFTVDDQVEKVLDNGDNSAEEGNDTITDNDDGTWTVTGLTGNGYGDTFDIFGDVTAFRGDGEFTLFLDGEEITVAELTGQDGGEGDGSDTEETVHRLEIVTPADGSVEFEFIADDQVEKVLDNGDNSAEESNDTVTEHDDGTWTVTGLTGNGYGDTFDYWGQILRFERLAGEYTLYRDGVAITLLELTGQDPADVGEDTVEEPTTGGQTPIGGGDGYSHTLTESDADATAGSVSALEDALSAASSGDVVYVTHDIDVGSTSFTVPTGVTVAGDRGVDGSDGPLLSSDASPNIVFHAEVDARVTGLRLRGPTPGETVTWQDGIGFDTPTYAVRAKGERVEVDNCEIYGFPDRAIYVRPGSVDAHIHHNYIYDNNGQGLGYGTACGDYAVVEYNYFHNNRHSTTCAWDAPGYLARYNHYSPTSVMHIIDAHDPVQGDVVVSQNIVECGESRTWDANDAVGVGGYDGGVDGSVAIEDNWFFDRADAFERDVAGLSTSGNVYGWESKHDPADVIPGHPGLSDRPWL